MLDCLISDSELDPSSTCHWLTQPRSALHWVQKDIHLFGGDPDHVVIAGDSAGAGSVAFHMAAYGGRDDKLFVGGVVESSF